jgi:hypothetical protein
VVVSEVLSGGSDKCLQPPKEPETAAAEKNIDARIPNSERLYQQDR